LADQNQIESGVIEFCEHILARAIRLELETQPGKPVARARPAGSQARQRFSIERHPEAMKRVVG
jgi:hypothetical protein